MVVSGNTVYIACGSLLAVDVSDPANPEQIYSNTGIFARDLALSGSFMFIAAWDEGLRVFEISDPAAPVDIAAYDIPGSAVGIEILGNYAYVA